MKCLNLKKYAVFIALALVFLVGALPIQADAATLQASLAFEVELQIDGDTPSKAAEFVFDLTALDEGAPLPEETHVVVEGKDTTNTAKFGAITYTAPGEYHYSISMREEGVPENYTHDETVYNVFVKVPYNTYTGTIRAAYHVSKDAVSLIADEDEEEYEEEHKEIDEGKPDAILFITTYDDPTPTPIPDNDPTPGPTPTPTPTPQTTDEPTPSDAPGSTPSEGTPEAGEPVDPSDPTQENEGTTPSGSPKTGDDTNDLPWIVLLCAVAAGLVWCAYYLLSPKNRGRDKK
jgi:pilin isopeptide linkage protein